MIFYVNVYISYGAKASLASYIMLEIINQILGNDHSYIATIIIVEVQYNYGTEM